LRKSEQRKLDKENKVNEGPAYKHNPKFKSDNNKTKLRNKPLSMLRPKKNTTQIREK